jgi:hypothetical protein
MSDDDDDVPGPYTAAVAKLFAANVLRFAAHHRLVGRKMQGTYRDHACACSIYQIKPICH